MPLDLTRSTHSLTLVSAHLPGWLSWYQRRFGLTCRCSGLTAFAAERPLVRPHWPLSRAVAFKRLLRANPRPSPAPFSFTVRQAQVWKWLETFLLGGRLRHTVGTVSALPRSAGHLVLRVHVVDRSSSSDPTAIVLESVFKAPLAINFSHVPLSPEEAQRLIAMLQQAVSEARQSPGAV